MSGVDVWNEFVWVTVLIFVIGNLVFHFRVNRNLQLFRQEIQVALDRQEEISEEVSTVEKKVNHITRNVHQVIDQLASLHGMTETQLGIKLERDPLDINPNAETKG